jgi:hypothetical protein
MAAEITLKGLNVNKIALSQRGLIISLSNFDTLFIVDECGLHAKGFDAG